MDMGNSVVITGDVLEVEKGEVWVNGDGRRLNLER